MLNTSSNIAKQQEEEIEFKSESFKSKLTLHYIIISTFASMKDWVSGKLPPGKLQPIKLTRGKFPPRIFPPMFLSIPTRVF